MVRRLKNKNQNTKSSPLKGDKTSVLDGTRKHRSILSTVSDFESETVSSSSPVKLDGNTKKVRRKKIRSTQDFNHLSSSMTSQDSDTSTKTTKKQTKKTKVVYDLPKIENVVEKRRKKLKCSKVEADLVSINKSLVDNNTFSFETESTTANALKKKLRVKGDIEKKSIDDSQNAVKIILDHQEDSEDDISFKAKRIQQRKDKINAVYTETEHKSTKRSKMKDDQVNTCSLNEYTLNQPCSGNLKNRETDVIYRQTKKQKINVGDTGRSKSINHTLVPSSINPKDINEREHEHSTFANKKYDVIKLQSSNSISNTTNFQEEHTNNNLSENKRRNRSNSNSLYDNSIMSPMKFKKHKRETNDNIQSTENAIEKSGLDYNAVSDVFSRSFDLEGNSKKPIGQEIQQAQRSADIERVKRNNNKKKTNKSERKSVNFISPDKVNNRRNTFNLEKSTVDRNNRNVAEKPLNKTIIQNENFDIIVPVQENILQSRRKHSTLRLFSSKKGVHARFEVSNMSPETLKTKKRRETFEMENADPQKNRQSIIDLTTPLPKKICNEPDSDSDVVFLETSDNKRIKGRSVKLVREATFSKVDGAVENEPSSPLKIISSFKTTKRLLENVEIPSQLNRTLTFTKDDIQNESLFDQNCDSQLLFDSPSVKNIDSSKVNKRKRWNKSRPSVSFLDSLDIANTSAPWNKQLLNTSFEKSHATNSSDLFESRGTPNRNKSIAEADFSKNRTKLETNKKTELFNRTSTFKTSTPIVEHKNMLLRQALLKDKLSGSINKNKHLDKVADRPPVKSVRTKMPNFALIHKRAYDKLENIKEMSERKAARAKLLLSGHKPTDESTLKLPSKSKRFLQFSPKVAALSTSTNENKKRNESINKSNISVTKIRKISPSKSNPKVVNKENNLTPIEKKRKLVKPSNIPKPKLPSNIIPEKKGFTRYGFKVRSENVKIVTKEEQMKAVATKTKVAKNTVQDRRNVIQGVRSNRRFELLMGMRNK